jgi:uncharacterized protein
MSNLTRFQSKFQKKYGPWAVITGASSGIGRALATALAEAKFKLVLVARSEILLQELARELTQAHSIECRVLVLDLASETGVERLTAETETLDIGLFIASAGFGTSGPFVEANLETELQMLHVNCRSLMALTWYFGQRFARQGRGGIVLMSSILAFQGMPWAAHYAATKAYVQTLAEALFVELRGKGVDVLAAAPGPTQSGFAARAGMTMGKAIEPADIAMPILRALGKHSTITPGLLSKILRYSLFGLPRWIKVRIMGQVMKGMIKPS